AVHKARMRIRRAPGSGGAEKMRTTNGRRKCLARARHVPGTSTKNRTRALPSVPVRPVVNRFQRLFCIAGGQTVTKVSGCTDVEELTSARQSMRAWAG